MLVFGVNFNLYYLALLRNFRSLFKSQELWCYLGIFGVAAALNGFLYKKINPLFRFIMAVGGLCMMIPGTVTDLIGLVLVAGICVYQYLSAKKDRSVAA